MGLFSKESASNLGLLVLRVALGTQMAALHGADKLRNFSERVAAFPDPLGLGHRHSLTLTVAAQFFCAILLVLGLASRLAALTLSFVMGVAVFLQQAPEPWKKKEMAALYFSGFLTILLLGPGRFSLDGTLLPRLFRRGGHSRAAGGVGARFASSSR